MDGILASDRSRRARAFEYWSQERQDVLAGLQSVEYPTANAKEVFVDASRTERLGQHGTVRTELARLPLTRARQSTERARATIGACASHSEPVTRVGRYEGTDSFLGRGDLLGLSHRDRMVAAEPEYVYGADDSSRQAEN